MRTYEHPWGMALAFWGMRGILLGKRCFSMILKEFARIPDKWLGDVEALLALCDKEF